MSGTGSESFRFRRPERARQGKYSSVVEVTPQTVLADGLRKIEAVEARVGNRSLSQRMVLKRFRDVGEAVQSEHMYRLLQECDVAVPLTYRIDHDKKVALMTYLEAKDAFFVTANHADLRIPRQGLAGIADFDIMARRICEAAVSIGNRSVYADHDLYGFFIQKDTAEPSIDFLAVDYENLIGSTPKNPIDQRAAIAYDVAAAAKAVHLILEAYVDPARAKELDQRLQVISSDVLAKAFTKQAS